MFPCRCAAVLLSGRVPVAALPDLMRAAGHFPSEAETDSLLAHVRFLADLAPADDAAVCSTSGSNDRNAADSLQQQQQQAVAAAAAADVTAGVDLNTFLLLYLSHCPVLDFSRQQVEAAFKTLGATTAAGVTAELALNEPL